MSAANALYKKKEVDVADHLKTVEGDDVPDELVEKLFKDFDAEKVATLKTDATERFNNGVKKGQKETAQKFEKQLREVFNVEDNTLEGEDLITHIQENLPTGGEGGVDISKLTDEDLAKTKFFIQKQKEWQKALKEKDTEKEKAVNAVKEEQTLASLFSEASAKALGLLDGKNPILPADAAKASKMKNKLLVDELKGHKFMKGDDGSLIPLDSEGKQLTDANGNPVDFDGLVEGIITNNFEFNTSEHRESPANKNKQHQQQQQTKWTGKAPSNKNEYTEMLVSDDYDTEQKVALKATYGEQFSG